MRRPGTLCRPVGLTAGAGGICGFCIECGGMFCGGGGGGGSPDVRWKPKFGFIFTAFSKELKWRNNCVDIWAVNEQYIQKFKKFQAVIKRWRQSAHSLEKDA